MAHIRTPIGNGKLGALLSGAWSWMTVGSRNWGHGLHHPDKTPYSGFWVAVWIKGFGVWGQLQGITYLVSGPP